MEARIVDGKIYLHNANALEIYVQDCINDAVERLKGHSLIKDNPLKYIITAITGADQPYDPQWQPHARFAQENLADTQIALAFITKYYDEFKEHVDYMASNMGKADFYESTFEKEFDLVRLCVIVYTDIAETIGIQTEIIK